MELLLAGLVGGALWLYYSSMTGGASQSNPGAQNAGVPQGGININIGNQGGSQPPKAPTTPKPGGGGGASFGGGGGGGGGGSRASGSPLSISDLLSGSNPYDPTETKADVTENTRELNQESADLGLSGPNAGAQTASETAYENQLGYWSTGNEGPAPAPGTDPLGSEGPNDLNFSDAIDNEYSAPTDWGDSE